MKTRKAETMTLINIQRAPDDLIAVFEQVKEYEQLPVLLFGLYEAQEEHITVIRGLVSGPGGMFAAEENEDFVGYWKQDFQKFEEFLADHELEEEGEDDEDEEEGDDDDEEEEEND